MIHEMLREAKLPLDVIGCEYQHPDIADQAMDAFCTQPCHMGVMHQRKEGHEGGAYQSDMHSVLSWGVCIWSVFQGPHEREEGHEEGGAHTALSQGSAAGGWCSRVVTYSDVRQRSASGWLLRGVHEVSASGQWCISEWCIAEWCIKGTALYN